MDLLTILGLVLGSSALTTLIGALFNRKKTNAEIGDAYADRLERRIKTLEERVDLYEMRNSISMSAINCAYACENKDGDGFCPVLKHIELHPIPQEKSND
jgi:hypothetical protein